MEQSLDKREKFARDIAKIAGVTALVFSIFSTVSLVGASSTDSISSESSAFDDILDSDALGSGSWDASWVPTGFTAWTEDSNIAWRWAKKNNCQDYGCISAEFISQNGCPTGLYAALNWLDSNDSVVSYANDTIPSLLPMQIAKLRFDDYEDIGKSGQMSTIRCN